MRFIIYELLRWPHPCFRLANAIFSVARLQMHASKGSYTKRLFNQFIRDTNFKRTRMEMYSASLDETLLVKWSYVIPNTTAK